MAFATPTAERRHRIVTHNSRHLAPCKPRNSPLPAGDHFRQNTHMGKRRRILVAVLTLVALVALAWLAFTTFVPHYPSVAERRKYFGDAFIYQGAPFCCIYVGLETDEVALFNSNFWRFADQHDIHKPKKRYSSYSGPPRATCKNDHVSVFVFTTPTTNIVARHDQFATLTSAIIELNEQSGTSTSGIPVSWQYGIWNDAYWPTNACHITKEGHEVLAPITGTVRMASNDTNFPVQDFRRLADALTVCLRSAFPDRAVRGFYYDGDQQLNRNAR